MACDLQPVAYVWLMEPSLWRIVAYCLQHMACRVRLSAVWSARAITIMPFGGVVSGAVAPSPMACRIWPAPHGAWRACDVWANVAYVAYGVVGHSAHDVWLVP